jgi:uncharacterized membrane protein
LKTAYSYPKILFAFCAFIFSLLAARAFYSGELHYLFLLWNIFLAWIPFAISSLFSKLANMARVKQAFVFCCWLAFFPNALYIVTDLVHLGRESSVPKWFDAVLIFSSSMVGLMMAFISLYRIENYLRRTVHKNVHAATIIFILFLGSFGVYLGRFLRWNSWDILSNPFKLLLSIFQRVSSPFEHTQTWGVTVVFTVFFYLLYISIKKLPGYLRQDGSRPSDA